MSVSVTYTLFLWETHLYETWTGTAKSLRTFSTQAAEVKFFFLFSYHNFEDTVTNFDKEMFRKEYYKLLLFNENDI